MADSMYRDTLGAVVELAKNPIVELVVSFALIEKLQARGVFGPVQATLMETGVATLITAQQIAPLVPDLLKAGGSLAGALALVPK